MLKNLIALSCVIIQLYSCTNRQEETSPTTATETKTSSTVQSPPVVETKPSIIYTLLISKDSIKKFIKSADTNNLKIIAAINRVDVKFLKRLDTIVVPSDLSLEIKNYFPFPFDAPFLSQVKKLLFFSYPTQSFAAY